jgi:FkbM family methyltransferase
MKKVFIDLGAGSGDDIQGYYDLHPENKMHEVHAFEPNPKRVSGIRKRFPNVKVYNAAAGTEDSKSKMFLGNHPNTSSLLVEKVSVSKNNFIEVQVIDLCKWMKENFTQDDYITMVVDIEGAEYELLHAMREQGLWSWVNEMYMEFHGQKLEGFDMKIEEDFTKDLIDFYGERVYIYRKHQHKQFLKLNAEGS